MVLLRRSDMDIIHSDLRIGVYAIGFSNTGMVNDKKEAASGIIHESLIRNGNTKRETSQSIADKNIFHSKELCVSDSDLNLIQDLPTFGDGILAESNYYSQSAGEHKKNKLNDVCVSPVSEVSTKSEEKSINNNDIETVVVSSDIRELSSGIKQERDYFNLNLSNVDSLHENSCRNLLRLLKKGSRKTSSNKEITKKKALKKKMKEEKNSLGRGLLHQLLRKEADLMREKSKKLYEGESVEERNESLAKEAVKRRESRTYYETPEKRRKRLDNEAVRKRERRMYNETPDERRKRLDREAKRRRLKRSNTYENETLEERRERLNRESTKRRESRKNQYANETDKERELRLEKDAIRAREMRFTRSAIESNEERRKRLVKDALRKRELRMHSGDDRMNNESQIGYSKKLEDNSFEVSPLPRWSCLSFDLTFPSNKSSFLRVLESSITPNEALRLLNSSNSWSLVVVATPPRIVKFLDDSPCTEFSSQEHPLGCCYAHAMMI
ncbi:vicilin-like seed storage protein At2g18540 [Venturia canescens]|uniref:vicilin-like seed storage protein At2g18540 n=1 Tax=Venturia canescens TaxID=32260 RepID=UPI001C9C32E2|nr:vicilin-like seed storage protein At2g18540 [Venturia canescens]